MGVRAWVRSRNYFRRSYYSVLHPIVSTMYLGAGRGRDGVEGLSRRVEDAYAHTYVN